MATIVAFHAHPDDEALLTGPGQGRRLEELRASAAILGAERVVHLGYADSGHGPVLYGDPPGRTRLLPRHRLDEMRGYGMPQSAITHRVDVRRHAAQKRAALAAHRTQVSGGGRSARLYRLLIRSPLPVFRAACGTEWFAEPGGRTDALVARDPLSSPSLTVGGAER